MKIVEGDILLVRHGHVMHQCNAIGVAGAGLALALRKVHPKEFTAYFDFVRSFGPASLGNAVLSGHHPTIVHLIAQPFPGPCTDYQAVEKALESYTQMNLRRIPVAIPYGMGCGLGGGNWETYLEILERWVPWGTIYRKSAKPMGR